MLTARPFDRDIRFTRRDGEALRIDQEVLNQPFHLGIDLVLRRWDDAVVLDVEDAARRDPLEGLLRDPDALPHLLDAYEITIVDVAVRARRDVELVGLVAQIGERPAHVVADAHCTRDRADEAVGDRIFLAEDADTAGALHPDLVLREQVLILVNFLGKGVDKLLYLLEKAQRRIKRQPADAEV